jgi:4-hydroxy-3-methylbut-2-enyl diphosphate reductase
VIKDLENKGVEVLSDVDDATENSKVVIRAHGVTPDIYERLKNKNIEIVDATCPYVHKIHKLVSGKKAEGYNVIIAGDRNHPEVIGINGWCGGNAYIANNPEDVDEMPSFEGSCCLVAQTTITKERLEAIYNKLKEKCKNIIKFDTICNATTCRQEEAAKIAKKSDVMLVIGSRSSSNTQKLLEISKKFCKETYNIETYGDLPPINIQRINTLGITAGASTPERIIKEVIEKMDELNKQENELSFQEAFESSMVTLKSGEIVKGKIIGFNNAEIYVDLGYKSDGIIPVGESPTIPISNLKATSKSGMKLKYSL